MPPMVSIPSESGVTSSIIKSPLNEPDKIDPWIPAPIATASSGFKDLFGLIPKKSCTIFWTKGIRVIPPTNNRSVISLFLIFASFRHCSQGLIVLLRNFWVSYSSLLLERSICRFFGPEASKVKYGRLIYVCFVLESSTLAFSAASLTLSFASWSSIISTPVCFLNSLIK